VGGGGKSGKGCEGATQRHEKRRNLKGWVCCESRQLYRVHRSHDLHINHHDVSNSVNVG
jgi:hypothetical protein